MLRFWRPVRLKAFAAGLTGIVLGLVAVAQAMEVTPMRYELGPSGADATQLVRVHNPSDKPLPVEVKVFSREFGADGAPTLTRAERDFSVFPPQALIAPNQTQSFRVQYVGPSDIPAARSYVVSFSQVPVSADKIQQTGIQVVYEFGTAAYVVPRGAKTQLRVLEPSRVEGGVRATLVNDGKRHAFLSHSSWTVETQNGSLQLNDEKALANFNSPVIAPGQSRDIFIPLDAKLPEHPRISVTLAQ